MTQYECSPKGPCVRRLIQIHQFAANWHFEIANSLVRKWRYLSKGYAQAIQYLLTILCHTHAFRGMEHFCNYGSLVAGIGNKRGVQQQKIFQEQTCDNLISSSNILYYPKLDTFYFLAMTVCQYSARNVACIRHLPQKFSWKNQRICFRRGTSRT